MASPLIWMRAVRDHVPKPSTVRLAVLWALALRMRQDGAGFASQRQLAEDADVHAATVRRHLKWAREMGYLVQTRRGHRIDESTVVASEYALTQPRTGAPLGTDPTAQTALPNRAEEGTQPRTGAHPRGLPPEVFPHPRVARRDPSPNGSPHGHVQTGGMEPHKNEPNARRAIATLRHDRALPFTEDALLLLAYDIGKGEPWTGYLTIKAATEQSFTGARDPSAVLRKRLGLA